MEDCNHKHRLEQYGPLLVSFRIKIPFSIDQIASSLIQDGVVISVEYQGKSTSELETVYYVHQHGCEEDCSNNCQKERLEAYLHCNAVDKKLMEVKNPALHVSNVQLKMHSMIRNFIKHQVSPLFSQDFHFEVEFGLNCCPSIIGFAWPKQMENMNKAFTDYPETDIDHDVIVDYVDFINSTFSCSTDPNLLRKQFNLSEADASNVAKIAKKVQYYFCDCGEQECGRCQFVQLPSLETGIIMRPALDCSTNISNSDRFRKFMMTKLRCTPRRDIESLSTKEWLQKHFSQKSISENGTSLTFHFEEHFFKFIVDSRLERRY